MPRPRQEDFSGRFVVIRSVVDSSGNVVPPSDILPLPALDATGGRGKSPGEDSAARAAEALTAGQGAGSSGANPDLDAATLCRLLSLLADKTRLRILWLLADGERTVGGMTAELRLPQPTVSHHLAWLRTMHLVSPRRAGKNVFYALGRAARAESGGALSLLTADAVVTIARRAGE
jgi:DNA-binding transcriptional ArsR family regulator